MTNSSGDQQPAPSGSDLASQLNDLKQLTEQLSVLSESLQAASASSDTSANTGSYGYSGS